MPRIPVVPDDDADVCPLCDATLGRRRGSTRRLIVLTPTPGMFRWRCPDCRGVWQVNAASTARQLVDSPA